MRKIFGVIIAIAIIAMAVWLLNNGENGSQASTGRIVAEAIFSCEAGKLIEARFRKESVELALSDGRNIDLSQVISASGARYANDDESIVFWNKGNTAFMLEDDQKTYTGCVEEGTEKSPDSEVYKNEDGTFLVWYPSVFEIEESNVKTSSQWSYSTAEEGNLGIKLHIPDSYQPDTNLQEAVFLVGWSKKKEAVQKCLESPTGNIMKTEKITIDGVTYQHTKYGSAGAGNFYEIDQYRTRKGERCYSIEKMIHSTNMDNYPPDQGIIAFDKPDIEQLLQKAWEGFQFTE